MINGYLLWKGQKPAENIPLGKSKFFLQEIFVHEMLTKFFFCRFYARDSGLLKFCIYAGLLGTKPPPTARRLVAFTFHPTEPFAISVQRTNADYVVNFHIRHVPSCEEKKNEKRVRWAL